MKIETIRFASRSEDDAFFYRTVHHLAAGCLLLGAKDNAVTALLEVVRKAVDERQRHRGSTAR